MEKKILDDYSKLIPAFTILAYILGFVIVSGHLSQFNFVNEELFNTAFVKSGLLFLVLVIPIQIILYLNFEEPTDNLLIAKKYYPTLTVNVLTYLLVITLFLIDYKKLNNWESTILIPVCLLDIVTYLLATSLLFKNKKHSTKIIIQLIIPVIFLIYFGFRFPFFGSLYLIILITSLFFVLALGVIADKKYSWGHYSVYIIWFILIAFLFGRNVYGNLPNYLGGGLPYKTTIIAKPESSMFLNQIGFGNADNFKYRIELIYISSNKYLLRKNNTTFYLSKELFNGFTEKE